MDNSPMMLLSTDAEKVFDRLNLSYIRKNADLRGIQVRETEHKIAVYADDLLFFISNPVVELSNLMKEFDIFGKISDFKINFDKSEALNVGLPEAVHFLQKMGPKNSLGRDLTQFESLTTQKDSPTRVISQIYQFLGAEQETTPPFCREWEKDLERVFTKEEWEKMFLLSHKSSLSAQVQETNYKYLSRWYYTPKRFATIFPSSTPMCWRCEIEEGSFQVFSKMILVYFLFIFGCHVVHGQFPRACTTDVAFRTKTCCPLWKDGSPCGSLLGRGRCRNWVVFTSLAAGKVRQYDDDRLDWPRHYYEKTCQCFGNYGGFNCGDCKPGYFGDNCERKITVVRKEIRQLTLVERKRFFSYLSLAKSTKSQDFVVLYTGDRHHRDTYRFVDATIYDIFAWIHYYSTKPILRNGTFDAARNYAHQGPAFPSWHRLGLALMERQIQLLTGDETFGMPYYDWRGETNCSICTDEFLGDNDVQGVLSEYSYFASWKSICSGYNYADSYCLNAADKNQMEKLHRKPGVHPIINRLPSFQNVEDTLKWKDFDLPPYNRASRRSFRNALEGFLRPSDGITFETNMHNSVHVYFGGTMSQVPISSNDPIFFLHHCFVDKIFEEWISRHNGNPDIYPENDEPGQGPNECSTPYFPCYRNKDFLQNSSNFGYTYSNYQGM
ncbi:tyrosinase-like [Gastrophryne carolinensis]